MFGYGGPIASMHLGRYGEVFFFFKNNFLLSNYVKERSNVVDLSSLSLFSLPCCRHALVSSKTKESKKVYTLYLERDALLSGTGSEKTWRVISFSLQITCMLLGFIPFFG